MNDEELTARIIEAEKLAEDITDTVDGELVKRDRDRMVLFVLSPRVPPGP